MAAELPEVTEGERHGNRTWFVGGKAFARALRDAITDGWLACAPPALARRYER
jgi:hypothetical protein